MAVAAILAVFLVVATCLFHFLVLGWPSGSMSQISMTAGVRVLVIVLVALGAHLVEIGVYAAAFGLGDQILNLGG